MQLFKSVHTMTPIKSGWTSWARVHSRLRAGWCNPNRRWVTGGQCIEAEEVVVCDTTGTRAFSVGSLGGVHGPVVGQDPSPFSRLQQPTASCGNLPASRGWRRSISSLAAGLEEFSVSSSGCSSSAKGDAGLGHVVVPAALTSVGQAVKAIRSGRVIAVPTDTLYGLASCAGSPQGVAAIYHIKRRQLHKPLAICVADPQDVQLYGRTEHLAAGLVADLLPGPVTLLLLRRADAPLAPELNPGVQAIGIRVPDAPFIRAICREHGGALALTSANISNGLSPMQIEEFQELWPACDVVFDGGELNAGRSGSTVIDLTQVGKFRITRQGAGFAQVVQLLSSKYGLIYEQGC